MTTSKKIIHFIEGVSISFIMTWVVSYLFSLAKYTSYSQNSASIIIPIVGIIVSIFLFWLLRNRYPYVAKGVMTAICLTIIVVVFEMALLNGFHD